MLRRSGQIVKRGELRGRYRGHHTLRRFCMTMGVSVDAVKDVGDIRCIVAHAVGRVSAEDREGAWKVAENVLRTFGAGGLR